MGAILYAVATPIGNLEDLTFRALRVLREADLIACEDTRRTAKLLQHYNISTPTISYHEHNEAARTPQLIQKLREGMTIALVSDAGTPLVSDPGYRLIRAAIENGFHVQPVPGPSAVLAALMASGLATDAFHFGGFLPARASQRRKAIEAVKHERVTLIFFEAPHRILETLADLEAALGSRPIVIARELTKVHEEFLRGTAAELRRAIEGRDSVKGEITLLIGKAPEQTQDETPVEEAVSACMRQGMSRMEAMKTVARIRGISKREVYRKLDGGG